MLLHIGWILTSRSVDDHHIIHRRGYVENTYVFTIIPGKMFHPHWAQWISSANVFYYKTLYALTILLLYWLEYICINPWSKLHLGLQVLCLAWNFIKTLFIEQLIIKIILFKSALFCYMLYRNTAFNTFLTIVALMCKRKLIMFEPIGRFSRYIHFFIYQIKGI